MFLDNEVKLLTEVNHANLIQLHEVLESSQVGREVGGGEGQPSSFRISIWSLSYAREENWEDM